MKILAIVPAKDEEKHIVAVVRGILEQGLPVVVVDDGSTDKTSQEAKQAGAIVLRNETSRGVGHARNMGCQYALSNDYDAIITLDGDGQHNPEEIPLFLNREADIVLGCRMNDLEAMPYIRQLSNRLTSWAFSYFTGYKLQDTQCGFKLIRREVLNAVSLNENGFLWDTECLIKAVKNGFTIEEVPIQTIYIDRGNSHQKHFFSGIVPFINLLLKETL